MFSVLDAPMTHQARLRVVLQDHDIRKLDLPHGIPETVAELEIIVRETFGFEGIFIIRTSTSGMNIFP